MKRVIPLEPRSLYTCTTGTAGIVMTRRFSRPLSGSGGLVAIGFRGCRPEGSGLHAPAIDDQPFRLGARRGAVRLCEATARLVNGLGGSGGLVAGL